MTAYNGAANYEQRGHLLGMLTNHQHGYVSSTPGVEEAPPQN